MGDKSNVSSKVRSRVLFVIPGKTPYLLAMEQAMSATADILSAICEKDVRLWIHHGALRYSDPKRVLLSTEIDLLRNERSKILSELTSTRMCANNPSMTALLIQPDHAPLTFQQEFALNYLGDEFFVIYSAQLSGDLNVAALSESLRAFIQRHEALRSRIVVTNMLPRQQINSFDPCCFRTVEMYRSPSDNVNDEVQRRIIEFSSQWLSKADTTFEALLLTVTSDRHVLIVIWDHLFHDYVSGVQLARELWSLYKSFDAGQPSKLTSKPMQYRNYAVWQRKEYLIWHEKNWQYWEDRLHGAKPIKLPSDPAIDNSRPRFSEFEISLNDKISLALLDVSRRERIGLPVMILAITSVAISRWSNQRDFVIPFVFSGRFYAEHIDIIGFMPNFLFLGISLTGHETLADLFNCLSREFISAIEHLYIGKTVDGGVSDLLTGPLFQWFSNSPVATAAMQPDRSVLNEQAQRLAIRPFSINWKCSEEPGATPLKFPVEILFWNSASGITGCLRYRADLFSGDTIQRFSKDIVLIAKHAVHNARVPVASLPR